MHSDEIHFVAVPIAFANIRDLHILAAIDLPSHLGPRIGELRTWPTFYKCVLYNPGLLSQRLSRPAFGFRGRCGVM